MISSEKGEKRMRAKLKILDFIEAGAYYRLLKMVGVITFVKMSRVLYTKEANRFRTILHKINQLEANCKLEHKLSKSFGWLDDQNFCCVFYGGIGCDSAVDYAELGIIQEFLEELTGEISEKRNSYKGKSLEEIMEKREA